MRRRLETGDWKLGIEMRAYEGAVRDLLRIGFQLASTGRKFLAFASMMFDGPQMRGPIEFPAPSPQPPVPGLVQPARAAHSCDEA